MTIPPHPDDVFAAALDALNAVLARDPVRVADVVAAWQAVYAAGLNMVMKQIDQGQVMTGARFEQLDRKLDRLLAPASLAQLEQRPVTAKELHDVRGEVQRMMESTVLMRENQHAIGLLHQRLQDLEQRLSDEIDRRNAFTTHIEALIERAVGEKESPQ